MRQLHIIIISLIFIGFSSPALAVKWYEGGTLHHSDMRQWNNSSVNNQLATAADWAISKDSVAGFVLGTGNIDVLKIFAIDLKMCIDELGTSTSRNVYDIATGCMILKGW